MDLRASEAYTLQPMERYAISTGLRVAIPDGWEGQIRPRSGLALQKGLGIPNSPSTIDADYRGELKVLLINLGPEPIEIVPGRNAGGSNFIFIEDGQHRLTHGVIAFSLTQSPEKVTPQSHPGQAPKDPQLGLAF